MKLEVGSHYMKWKLVKTKRICPDKQHRKIYWKIKKKKKKKNRKKH